MIATHLSLTNAIRIFSWNISVTQTEEFVIHSPIDEHPFEAATLVLFDTWAGPNHIANFTRNSYHIFITFATTESVKTEITIEYELQGPSRQLTGPWILVVSVRSHTSDCILNMEMALLWTHFYRREIDKMILHRVKLYLWWIRSTDVLDAVNHGTGTLAIRQSAILQINKHNKLIHRKYVPLLTWSDTMPSQKYMMTIFNDRAIA